VVPDLERELSELYREHASGLLRYVRSAARDAEEARDAVQETFLRYFQERRYGRTIESPRAWLYQVARNYLAARWNSTARCESADQEIDAIAGEGSDPEALATRKERAREIQTRLTGRELEVLRLRAEGLSYEEIGGVLDIRAGTVGALLSRISGKLRWPPGRGGTIGLGTAQAVHSLLLGGSNWPIPTSSR
jgi:RNA polymerase sigma-70 factor (ECF subfamily)